MKTAESIISEILMQEVDSLESHRIKYISERISKELQPKLLAQSGLPCSREERQDITDLVFKFKNLTLQISTHKRNRIFKGNKNVSFNDCMKCMLEIACNHVQTLIEQQKEES